MEVLNGFCFHKKHLLIQSFHKFIVMSIVLTRIDKIRINRQAFSFCFFNQSLTLFGLCLQFRQSTHLRIKTIIKLKLDQIHLPPIIINKCSQNVDGNLINLVLWFLFLFVNFLKEKIVCLLIGLFGLANLSLLS